MQQADQMEAIGRMTSAVAHDFNNLLTVIRGFSELLLLDGATERGRPKVEQIIAAVDRGSALARQMLAFGALPAARSRTVDTMSPEPATRLVV